MFWSPAGVFVLIHSPVDDDADAIIVEDCIITVHIFAVYREELNALGVDLRFGGGVGGGRAYHL